MLLFVSRQVAHAHVVMSEVFASRLGLRHESTKDPCGHLLSSSTRWLALLGGMLHSFAARCGFPDAGPRAWEELSGCRACELRCFQDFNVDSVWVYTLPTFFGVQRVWCSTRR